MNRFSSVAAASAAALRQLIALAAVAFALGSSMVRAQPCAVVTNVGSEDISLVDTVSNTIVSTISVGLPLTGIAITPDGSTAYVVTNTTTGATVIDLTTHSVVTTIGLPSPAQPGGIAITPDGARVYVAIQSEVAVINVATNTLLTTVPISSVNPPNVAITPNGKLAYVTGADGSNNVTVIDTATNTVVGTFLTGAGSTTPDGIAFTPDGMRAYVANNASEAMNVAVIDTSDNSVVTSIPLDGRPTGIAITPDGAHAYALNGSFPADPFEDAPFEVSVIDTTTNTVVATIPVGGLAFEVGFGFTPDGTHAYVPNSGLNSIAVIATATNVVVTAIPGGVNPFGVAIRPAGSCSVATVVIGGCDSGVPNTPLPGGGTITDGINQCAAGAQNHGAFVSCVSHVTDDLKKAGIITGAQKGAIERCAGKARIP